MDRGNTGEDPEIVASRLRDTSLSAHERSHLHTAAYGSHHYGQRGENPRSPPPSLAGSRSIASHNSDFTVHTGPPRTRSPLGLSNSYDHYIKPVPPTYVTEYEAAYSPRPMPLSDTQQASKLPSSPRSRVLKPSFAILHTNEESPGSPLSMIGRGSPPLWEEQGMSKINSENIRQEIEKMKSSKSWNNMADTLKLMATLGFERTLATALVPKINDKLLDGGIEYAYNHLKHRLESRSPYINVTAIPEKEQLMYELCELFIDNMDAIKNFSTESQNQGNQIDASTNTTSMPSGHQKSTSGVDRKLSSEKKTK